MSASTVTEKAVVLAIWDPLPNFHPFSTANSEAFLLRRLVIENLVHRDEKGEYHPRLASSWSISPDKKTYVFKLRRGVQFSDGKPFTAADVEFSYRAIFDPRLKGESWRAMFEVHRVEVVNEHEIHFHTQKPEFEKWRNLAINLRVYPKHLYEGAPIERWNNQLIGTGPYALTRLDPTGTVQFHLNPLWWGRKDPYFKDSHTFPRVSFRVVRDAWTAATLINKGELDDFALDAPSDLEKVRDLLKTSSIALVHEQSPYYARTISLQHQLNTPALQSRDTRCALNYLLNRTDILKKIYRGRLQPMTSQFTRISPYFTGEYAYSFDLGKASKLLKTDGWKENATIGLLEKEIGGRKFPLRLEILYYDNAFEPWLTILKEDAAKIGVEFVLQRVESSTVWQLAHEKKYQIQAMLIPDWQTLPPNTVKTGGFYNNMGLSDPLVDRIAEQLPTVFDAKARLKLERQIVRRMEQLCLQIPAFEYTNAIHLMGPRLEVPKGMENRGIFFWRLKNRSTNHL